MGPDPQEVRTEDEESDHDMSAPNVDMLDAMRQIAELRGIPVQTLFEALANAL